MKVVVNKSFNELNTEVFRIVNQKYDEPRDRENCTGNKTHEYFLKNHLFIEVEVSITLNLLTCHKFQSY